MKKNLSSGRGDIVGTQERNSKGLLHCINAQRKERSNLMGQNPNFRGGQNRDSRWGQNQGSRGGKTVLEGGKFKNFFGASRR